VILQSRPECDLGLDLRHEELRITRDEDLVAPLERVTWVLAGRALRTTEIEKCPTDVHARPKLLKSLGGCSKINDCVAGLVLEEAVGVPLARASER
jgi:hypothetical protein